MKVDGSVKSLLQGVSQQPARDRLPGQCTEQINMSSDPVAGLTRRPPSDLVGSLGNALGPTIRGWHDFKTLDGNKYLAKFVTGGVLVTDLNGVAKTVTVSPLVTGYLSSTADLAFHTIDNDTYITNKNVVPAMAAGAKTYFNMGVSGYTPAGIIQVLGGQYGREYVVKVGGVMQAKYRTADGSSADHAALVRTTHIARTLVYLLTNAFVSSTTPPPGFDSGTGQIWEGTGVFANPADWTVTLQEDTILIRNISNLGTFKLSVSDDAGNINLKAMTEQVPDTSDLPRYAPQGYIARVATETDPDEDLWLQFNVEGTAVATGAGFGLQGFWQETVAPSIPYQLNLATMPIVMTYTPGTQVFNVILSPWNDRQVGTESTNPQPSFIGNPIEDISSFQGRLVFLAGKNVIMTRTNRIHDFWIGSASAITDSDPIDVSSTAVEASIMQAAVPHNRDLTIHSPNGQFIIFGRTALTPANAALVLTTAFEADLEAKPVSAGRNIFFAHSYGRFVGIREFYTEGGTDINDTRPVTQHVNRYIVGDVIQLVSSSNYDMLVVRATAPLNRIWVYKYIWSDNEKVQSSWSKWDYPDSILHAFFDGELLYLVVSRGGTQYLLRQSLDVQDTEGMNFPVFTDYRFTVSGVNTTFNAPSVSLYNGQAKKLIAVQGAGCPNPGMEVPILTGDGNPKTLKYDMQGGTIEVGLAYRSLYIPTMPFIKDADGVVIANAKLVVKHFICTLQQTGNIIGRLISRWGNGPEVKFEGRIVGDINNVVGEVALSDDKFFMPFRTSTQRAEIELYTEDYLPMTLLDIEWAGQYKKSGRRITIGGQG